MKEYPEFVKEKQGRPASKSQLDMESKVQVLAVAVSAQLASIIPRIVCNEDTVVSHDDNVVYN